MIMNCFSKNIEERISETECFNIFWVSKFEGGYVIVIFNDK